MEEDASRKQAKAQVEEERQTKKEALTNKQDQVMDMLNWKTFRQAKVFRI